MRKIFTLREHIYREGEYLIGSEATGSHACYLIYGVLKRGDRRTITPGKGHEEILAVIEGLITVNENGEEYSLSKGQAVHLKDEETITISVDESQFAIYVLAGGHSDAGYHHH